MELAYGLAIGSTILSIELAASLLVLRFLFTKWSKLGEKAGQIKPTQKLHNSLQGCLQRPQYKRYKKGIQMNLKKYWRKHKPLLIAGGVGASVGLVAGLTLAIKMSSVNIYHSNSSLIGGGK